VRCAYNSRDAVVVSLSLLSLVSSSSSLSWISAAEPSPFFYLPRGAVLAVLPAHRVFGVRRSVHFSRTIHGERDAVLWRVIRVIETNNVYRVNAFLWTQQTTQIATESPYAALTFRFHFFPFRTYCRFCIKIMLPADCEKYSPERPLPATGIPTRQAQCCVWASLPQPGGDAEQPISL